MFEVAWVLRRGERTREAAASSGFRRAWVAGLGETRRTWGTVLQPQNEHRMFERRMFAAALVPLLDHDFYVENL